MIRLALILIVGLILGRWVAVELGLLPPLSTRTLVRVRGGRLSIEKGDLTLTASEHVAAILRESQISEGYVAITSAQRVMFSRLIPSEIHQRLRNVLLNQAR